MKKGKIRKPIQLMKVVITNLTPTQMNKVYTGAQTDNCPHWSIDIGCGTDNTIRTGNTTHGGTL